MKFFDKNIKNKKFNIQQNALCNEKLVVCNKDFEFYSKMFNLPADCFKIVDSCKQNKTQKSANRVVNTDIFNLRNM